MQDGGAPGGAAKPENPLGDFRLPNIEVLREVARGGFGVVYEAHQSALNRTVAVKILSAQVRDDQVRRRFERECVAMGRLSDHPHIVTVFDAGFGPAGQPYILMDFMPGGTLATLVETGPMRWQDAVATGVKLASALETAHQAGVLHRDIKPENVLLSAYGEPELGDFGIARLQGGPETRTGSSLTASIAHAAPELLAGDPPSVQTDLYALGSTLFVLLSGGPAFVKHTDESVLPAITRITAEPVPDLRPAGVPDPVAEVVERLMAKDPAARFPSALELARHLQDLQRRLGQPATAIHVADVPGEAGDTGPITGPITGPALGPAGTGAAAAGLAGAGTTAGTGPPGTPRSIDRTGIVGLPPRPPAEPAAGLVTGEGAPARPGGADGSSRQPDTITTPGGAPPPPGGDPAPAPARRRRWPLALGGVLVVALVAVGAFALLRDPADPTDEADVASPTAPATASPTPSATDSPEPDPAAGEGEVLDVSVIAGQIAELLGESRALEPHEELDARRYTTAAYEPLIQDFAWRGRQDALAAEGRVLTALHLVPPDADYAEIVRGVWEERLPAFYDESADRLHVRSDTPTLSVLTRRVMADEIAVALLDQSYDFEASRSGDLDAERALTALFLGDAQVVTEAWAQRFLTESERAQVVDEQDLRPDARFRAAPQVARAELSFPLVEGSDFVQAVIDARGPEAVDAVYADPPTTSSQIIHPERYLDRREPVDVSVTTDPGEGYEPLVTRTFGEFDLLQLFVGFEQESADAAAAGWAGGELRAWAGGEDTVVAVWLEFDTPADADEACVGVATWYLGVGGESVGPNRFATDDDAMVVGCEGTIARFAVAPDVDLAYGMLLP